MKASPEPRGTPSIDSSASRDRPAPWAALKIEIDLEGINMGRIAEAIKRAERERASRTPNPPTDRGAAAVMDALPSDEFDSDRMPTARHDGLGVKGAAADRFAFAPPPPVARRLDFGATHRFAPAALRHAATRVDSGVAAAAHWNVHSTVVAARERSSAITEQYRAARTWLLRRNASVKRSCVAITSSVPREGKSVTTANLAITMAEVRHLNVLAVDCDFRQASLARLYRMPNTPGLADVITGRVTLDEAIAATPIANLALLPAGTCHDLPSGELLNSKAAARVFDELRERFHYVLVDTPPVQSLSDVGAVGALCTGIVLVVRMNRTAAHVVRQSVHWLHSNHLNVLGCIASDCRTRGTRYEYENIGDDND